MKIDNGNIRSIKTNRYNLTDKQQKFVDNLIKAYNLKTQNSKNHMIWNRKHFCDWINSLCFKMSLKELIYPIICKKSSEASFIDIDNNKYVDIAMGYGVGFHGHNPSYVTNAVKEQLKKGYELGPQREETADVAKLICELTGVERVLFSATGSEAVMIAIRMARSSTGRNKIAIFKNSFHGTFDGILAKKIENQTLPMALGTPLSLIQDVVVLDYASERSLDYLKQNISDLAGILIEPVQSRTPELQPIDFLKELRTLTEKNGTALIFDETVTGFRVHSGGIQKLFGIYADIVIYGKSLGGGMPISAVGGRKKWFDVVDGGEWQYEDNSFPNPNCMFFAGTYYKHPLSIAGAKAALSYLKSNSPQMQNKADSLTSKLAKDLNDFFNKKNVPVKVNYFSSMFRFIGLGSYSLLNEPIEMELLFYILIYKGIYTWERRICYLSAVHTEEDVSNIVEKVKECIEELRDNGFDFCI
jgi:glutamate-1-semialdehyde aminotransferase